MKKIYLKLAAAALCLSWSLSGMSQTTATDDYMYIEDFQIKPGDTKLVDVWINSSIPFMHIMDGKVVLPDGLEMVPLDPVEIDPELFIYDKNEFSEHFAMSTNFSNYELMTGPFAGDFSSNMRTSHYIWTKEKTSRQFVFVIPSYTKIEIMGNGQYQLFQFKVKASDDFTGGMIEVCPDGYEFITYWGWTSHEGGSSLTETTCGGQPSRARVSMETPSAIDDVKAAEAAGDGRYYDLQGRALNGEPATPGIYVKDGKKVLVK